MARKHAVRATGGHPSSGLVTSVTVTCALLLAACGASTGFTLRSIPTSWVSENSGMNSLIQWVSDGGSRFTGTVTSAYISASGRHIHTDDTSVSGLISEGNIEITINGNQFSGTINPTHLSIAIPNSNGNITNLTFVPGTEGEYNGFLSQLRSTVADNVNAYNQQQATEAAQQKVESDAGTVTTDINNVQGDISQLQSDVQGTSSDLAQEKTDLGTTQSDFASTQQAVSQYGTGSGNGVCSDAGAVASDAGAVASDASNVQQDIKQLQSDVSQLQSDANTLRNAEAAIPGYVPSGTPSTTNVNASVSQSQTAINQAVSTMNGYISTANSYQQQAYALADQASSIGNCGEGPSAPAGISPITG